LIASPIVPSPSRLGRVRGAVLMAGTRDAQKNMTDGLHLLKEAHVRATFMTLPKARHGEMGEEPEKTMDLAFAWLDDNAPPP
jgi:hypothetical protein